MMHDDESELEDEYDFTSRYAHVHQLGLHSVYIHFCLTASCILAHALSHRAAGPGGNLLSTAFSLGSGSREAKRFQTASSSNSDGRSRFTAATNSNRSVGTARPMTAVSGAGYQSAKGINYRV